VPDGVDLKGEGEGGEGERDSNAHSGGAGHY